MILETQGVPFRRISPESNFPAVEIFEFDSITLIKLFFLY